MTETYSYKCKDYPGMESCPFHVEVETEAEIWKQMELHASIAHGENTDEWSSEDRKYIGGLITTRKS